MRMVSEVQRGFREPDGPIKGDRGILIVDDAETVRNVLSRMLSEWGFQVQTASDGTEALHLFADSPFGLVVTDFNMPGMDGLTLAAKIKGLSPSTPVILMSGEDLRASGEDKSCVVSILQKPFRWQDMIETVVTAMAGGPVVFASEASA